MKGLSFLAGLVWHHLFDKEVGKYYRKKNHKAHIFDSIYHHHVLQKV